jgi:trimeric autotransporter adhesin
MKRFRPRLTYANVIASLALFVALGGSAVAAGLAKNSVGPNQLKKGAVTASKIGKKAVTNGKIAPKAVTAGKLGPNAVLPGNLGAGIISTDKIAASAVTAEKIKNNVVTTNKITNAAVTSQKLAATAVGTNNLAEGSVTGAKIAKETITAEKLAKGAVGNVETLKTGQTERGVFNIGGYNPTVGKEVNGVGSISFPLLLAANPAAVTVVKGTAFTPQCPGLGGGGTTPEAVAGAVCVYLTAESNLDATTPLTATGTRLGVNLTAKGDKEKEGNFVASGVWAVTAP